MRIVACDPAAVGLALAQSMYDTTGRVLLRAGVRLTAREIDLLAARGYVQIPVSDAFDLGIEAKEVIRDETREVASMAVHHVLRQAQAARPRLAVGEILQSVDQVLADITANHMLLAHLRTLRSVSEALLTHSVNVTTLAIIIARGTYMDPADMRALGVGAMLHDIGKVYYRRPGDADEPPLRPDGEERPDRHPIDGFELLRRQYAVDLRAAHVAFQHHERLDGSGFPRGLRGKAIHPWARMVAVADIYDNLTAQTAGRAGCEPKEAIGRLMDMGAVGKLDGELINLMANRLAIYPLGSIVELDSREIGLVTGYAYTKDPEASDAPGIAFPRVRLLSAPEATPDVLITGGSPRCTIRRILPDYPQRDLAAATLG